MTSVHSNQAIKSVFKILTFFYVIFQVESLEQMWKDVHFRERGCGGMVVRV